MGQRKNRPDHTWILPGTIVNNAISNSSFPHDFHTKIPIFQSINGNVYWNQWNDDCIMDLHCINMLVNDGIDAVVVVVALGGKCDDGDGDNKSNFSNSEGLM